MATDRKPPAADEDDAVVFSGSNWLWIILSAMALLAGIAVVWALLNEAGTETLVLGLLFIAVLVVGAWFSWQQRRQVVLDRHGLLVRSYRGEVRFQRTWKEIERIESRRMPSQPLSQLVVVHCSDGKRLLIDPQQVHDTVELARQAERWLKTSGRPAARRH